VEPFAEEVVQAFAQAGVAGLTSIGPTLHAALRSSKGRTRA